MSLFNLTAPVASAFRQIGPARLAKAGLTLAAILAVGYLAREIDFGEIAKRIDFSEDDAAAWYQGKAGYIAAGMLFTAIGGPRQVVAFFAAYFFGLWPGLVVSTLAAGMGCALTAGLARLFESRVRSIIQGRIDVAFDYWRRHPVSTTLIIRLLPVGSNFVTNLAAGATGVPYLTFVLASMAGYIPQMAVFALMGSGVDVGAGWQVSLGIALFVVLMVFGLWVYGRFRKRIRARRGKARRHQT